MERAIIAERLEPVRYTAGDTTAMAHTVPVSCSPRALATWR
jgi:hypothetical protein